MCHQTKPNQTKLNLQSISREKVSLIKLIFVFSMLHISVQRSRLFVVFCLFVCFIRNASTVIIAVCKEVFSTVSQHYRWRSEYIYLVLLGEEIPSSQPKKFLNRKLPFIWWPLVEVPARAASMDLIDPLEHYLCSVEPSTNTSTNNNIKM